MATKKRSPLQTLLFLLAILTSPLACCGGITFLNVLPSSIFPNPLDFFSSEARIENRTRETLYLTPITTTFGSPQVIRQSGIRQRDFRVLPGQSLVLEYDAADAPLSGIVICRTDENCRLLPVNYSKVYSLDSFDNLPDLEPGWLKAVRDHRPYDFMVVGLPVLGLLPVVFFIGGWMAGRRKSGGGL